MGKVFEFKIKTRPLATDPAMTVVDVTGEIDVFSSQQMKQELGKLVDAGAATIVVNLEQVNYMDSTGLGVLVSILKRVRERDGDVMLGGLNPHMTKIFEITGLAKAFTILRTEEEAGKK